MTFEHFKTGDPVTISFRHAPVAAGAVLFASTNGRSLALMFDAILGHYVGMMPVMWSDDLKSFIDLIHGEPVMLARRDENET